MVLEAKPEDFETSIRTMEFTGHSGSVTTLSVSYDASYFISGSVDQTIRLWSLKIGHCLAVYKSHIRTVWSVKISPKGFYFASGGADSMIFLWSTNKNAPLASYTEHTEDVTHVDFTDNLNYIVSASLDKTFRIWNIENGKMVRILFFDYPVTA